MAKSTEISRETQAAPRAKQTRATGPFANGAALSVSGACFEHPVGKRILKDGGKQLIEERGVGRAIHFEAESFVRDYLPWRAGLTPCDIMVCGTFKGGAAADGAPVSHKWAAAQHDFILSLTNRNLEFAKGQPGIVRIDVDVKDPSSVHGIWPVTPPHFQTHEEVADALALVLPEAADVVAAIRDGTSAQIYDKKGKQIRGAGSFRVEIPTSDAALTPRVLEIIHLRSWLNELGWAYIDKGGTVQIRSMADQYLARKHQPDFAAPDLEDGLEQRRQVTVLNAPANGAAERWLDPVTVTISDDDRVEAERLMAEAKAELEPRAREIRAGMIEVKVTELVARGVPERDARKAAERRYGDSHTLLGSDVVSFADGQEITVAELLANGAAYDERDCHDPIDPDGDDGRFLARFFWNAGGGERGGVGIYSFRGNRWFRMMHDDTSLMAQLAAGLDAHALARAGANADVTSTTERLFERAAARELGLGSAHTAFRADVAAIVAERAASNETTDGGDGGGDAGASARLCALNEEWFVITGGSRCAVGRFVIDEGREVLEFYKPSDFVLHTAAEQPIWVATANGARRRALGKAWLEWPGRRQYPNFVYLGATEPERPGALNLWRGFGDEPKEGDWSLIDWHIKHIICGGDQAVYNYLTLWLAWVFQFPDKKPGVVPVWHGDQGAGKGIIAHMLARLFGTHSFYVTQPGHVVGRFNKHLLNCLFLLMDEAVFAGDPQTTGPLKALITDDVITIEPKFVDAIQKPNYLTGLMLSNSKHPAHVEANDRRYFVCPVSSEKVGDKAYFVALKHQIDSGGAAAFLHAMLHREIDADAVRFRPETNATSEVKRRGFVGVDRWLHETLNEGRPPLPHRRDGDPYLHRADFKEWEDHAIAVGKEDLYGYYVNWVNNVGRIGGGVVVAQNVFYQDLKGRLGHTLNTNFRGLLDHEKPGPEAAPTNGVLPSAVRVRAGLHEDGLSTKRRARFGRLDAARDAFGRAVGGVVWDGEDAD